MKKEKATGTDRSEMRFYRNGDQRTTGKPFVALSDYGDETTKNITKQSDYSVFIDQDVIKGISVANGALSFGDKYMIEVQVVGYEKNHLDYSFLDIGVEDVEPFDFAMDDETNEGWSVFSITGSEYKDDYFASVRHATFNADTGWTIELNSANSKVVKNSVTGRNELWIQSNAINCRPRNTNVCF